MTEFAGRGARLPARLDPVRLPRRPRARLDLRTVGSGNLGAANVFRNLGRDMGIAVMAADILKGVVAVVIARLLTDDPWPAIAAGAAMAGHVFPVWLRFKGGKGVAVGGGAVIGADAAGGAHPARDLGAHRRRPPATRRSPRSSASLVATPLVWALGYPLSTWSSPGRRRPRC